MFKDYSFLLILISFVSVDPRVFSDVTHCRFRPRIPKVCVMGFSKIPVLILGKISTCVFYAYNSIKLDSLKIIASC